MKPTLSICEQDLVNPWNTLGLKELLTCLINSGAFNITYHKDKFSVMRGERASTLYYNNKKIFLDLWDYSTPTHTEDTLKANYDLIIKLQHPKVSTEDFERECQNKKMYLTHTKEERLAFFNKIIPWTFFCSRMFRPFIDKEEEIKSEPIERIGFFCGKDWKCRRTIKAKLIKENIPYLTSDQETHTLPLKLEEYLQWMKTSKYGIIIHGRGAWLSEGKNRREIDYMMLKKPILLNYKPNYYNPLVEGKHYIYIDANTCFDKLETMYNINEIAMNGFQWYKDNASTDGVTKTFLQIMSERKFNE